MQFDRLFESKAESKAECGAYFTVVNMIALFRGLHSFFSSSTVHVRWEEKQDLHHLKKVEIGRVSDTRWSL